jgi:hypothetical protein
MSFIINGTSGATFPDSTTQATGVPSPGTAGNVLTSNGTIWTSAAAAAFDAGTRLAFQQTAAPTGWTKDTTTANLNDSMMRIITGTNTPGGSTAFSTWNAGTATGAFTLTTSELPSHTHSTGSGAAGGVFSPVGLGQNSLNGGSSTGSSGGGGSHSHSLTRNLKYFDFIIAVKN